MRIQLGLDNLDSVEQLAYTFKRKILALHRYYYTIGRSKRIDCDQAQRRAAVNQYVVIVLNHWRKHIQHDSLAVAAVQHLYFCSYKVNVTGDYIQILNIRTVNGLAHINPVNQAIVYCAIHLSAVYAKTTGGIGLRVRIYQQHLLFQGCQRRCQIHTGCSLTYATLLVGQSNYLTHLVFCYIISRTKIHKSMEKTK